MKNNLRLSLGVNKTKVANPQIAVKEILALLRDRTYTNTDLVLFPALSLVSPSSGSLLSGSLLISQCQSAVEEIRTWSHNKSGYYFIGTVTQYRGQPISTMCVLHEGSIVAQIPLSDQRHPFLSSGFSQEYTPEDSIFQIGELRVGVHTQSLDDLVSSVARKVKKECDILLVPTYDPMVAGKIKSVSGLLKELTASLGMTIAVTNGGIGDTSSPDFFHGFYAVYQQGEQLAFDTGRGKSLFATVDIDPDVITNFPSSSLSPVTPFHKISPTIKKEVLRPISRNPFMPEDSWEQAEYMAELFFYQTQSLVARMENTGIKNIVLGLSGGLDSTAALMVSVAACDYLELPRTNIHGITLPGLGTSPGTHSNALSLLDMLHVTKRDISIKAATLLHFQDIGHTGTPDTTYENVQARERTQILLDIANMVGGLVVGTSDLSEEALGFCTFGGDHLANYNVNICMTKTMLKSQLEYVMDSGLYPEVKELLQQVISTPISPELLPPSKSGQILQKTEDILGPYELHEFFLYYFIKYHMAPSKIYQYAVQTFGGEMSRTFILEKLKLFIRKFCAGQFKRSCAPDAASITHVNLLQHNYTIASDLDPAALLADLDSVE